MTDYEIESIRAMQEIVDHTKRNTEIQLRIEQKLTNGIVQRIIDHNQECATRCQETREFLSSPAYWTRAILAIGVAVGMVAGAAALVEHWR